MPEPARPTYAAISIRATASTGRPMPARPGRTPWAARYAHDDENRRRSARPQRGLCGLDGTRLRRISRARRFQNDRRRQELAQSAFSWMRIPAVSIWRWIRGTCPRYSTPPCGKRSECRGNLRAEALAAGWYKPPTEALHWSKISNKPGFLRGTLGKIGVSVAAEQSADRLRHRAGVRRRGVPLRRRRRDLETGERRDEAPAARLL